MSYVLKFKVDSKIFDMNEKHILITSNFSGPTRMRALMILTDVGQKSPGVSEQGKGPGPRHLAVGPR